jgi:hypothetical protein
MRDTIICTWSKKRAEKERRDRERLIKLAEEVLEGEDSKVFFKERCTEIY